MMMLLFWLQWLTRALWFILSACLLKHLLALLQANCLDLVRCAFLHKLSACVRHITAFCQYVEDKLANKICRFGRCRYISA